MEDRFISLISRKLSGSITGPEVEELESMLVADPSRRLTLEWFEQMFAQERQRSPSLEAREAYIRHWLKYRDEFSEDQGQAEPHEFPRHQPVRGRIRRAFAAGWGIAAVTILGLGIWWGASTRPANPRDMGTGSTVKWETAVTRVAEKKKLILPDGSLVWLNAGSSIRYEPDAMQNGARQVYLEGEAFFDISHDEKRPFRVRSGAIEIKVLGTAFNVRAYPEDSNIETSLIRGAVEVRLDDRPDDVYKLRPHEKLVVAKKAASIVPPTIETKPVPESRPLPAMVSLKRITLADSGKQVEETAWLQDKLVFRSEQFATLSKMLERKYGYHFIMESDRVRELSFTGSFTTETIEQALQAMQMVHPFQYRIQNENIYIR